MPELRPEFGNVFGPLAQGRDLEVWEAENVMHYLIGGNASDEEILSILNSLCDKGATETEIVAFAGVMRSKATLLDHAFDDLVDTCGTGGGKPTFNISTAAAFVAAGAGVRIAKHGNRSTTGLGSADVLERLGVRLGAPSEELVHLLETVGIAFLFAPAHHPAMKHVAGARKMLGRRSVFNLLGPLVNPAGATRQSIGVHDPNLLGLMGNVVKCLGMKKAVLVHSEDGLDEVSPCAPTRAVLLEDGELREVVFMPEDFSISTLAPEVILPGRDLAESADFLVEAISAPESLRASAVIPSAAVAIGLAGLEPDLASAAERAKKSIAEGRAIQKLSQLVASGSKS
jgi:anthranilate phosphoribosyltransferase